MIKLLILLLFCFGIIIAMLVAEIYDLRDDISKKDLLILLLKERLHHEDTRR